MTRELRDRAKSWFVDALAAVPGDAPTDLPGWTAHDLAVHVWQLDHDPRSWAGAVGGPFARVTARRTAETKARWSYEELVARLREAPAGFRCMPEDRLEDYRHALGEYWVHLQDVARPNGLPMPEPDRPMMDALWKRARVAALALHWRHPGLTFVRRDATGVRIDSAAITPGRTRLVVTGRPTELMSWTYGRPDPGVQERRTGALPTRRRAR